MSNPVSQPLSDRAKLRLRLAAALLRNGGKLKLSREHFYDEMMAHINGLSATEQADLKELVDWLEDYDKAATPLVAGKPAVTTPPLKKRR